MTDADIDKTIDNFLAIEQRELDLKKRYISEFKKVLPVRKVLLLQKAEREFKKALLLKFKELRQGDE